MHIKFTSMEYTTPLGDLGAKRYIESKKSVWIPVEALKRATVRQEDKHYRILFLEEGKTNSKVEVVKENPIELLKNYEKKEKRRSVIKKVGRRSQ